MIRFAVDLASTLMNTRSVTIISYNISFSLYTFRDISSIFMLQAEGRGMGKHLYMLCTCRRVYYWPQGYLVLKPFHICFPLLSYCIAMQKRILNQTMMSTMVSECPVLNPHILRRASDSGKIVWRCPLRGHTFFSPHSRLFNLFTAVSV